MPVYTVHGPVTAGGAAEATDRFVFVRDGFHVWAAVAAPLWLAFHRLWLALVGYLVLVVAVAAGLWALRLGSDVRFTVMLLIALLMGFEASSLRRWTLSRGKWRELDVVAARNSDEAERRFFDRWAEGRTASADGASIDRGSPPPVRPAARVQPPHGEIMGLFPQPGAPR
ncbi:DUF2628 domain-containing protein [Bradyrhizobium prioriisuperbiae]|uniref:DUF2628 domain-containing protein n=1 Tax=Bradyrhizobium prioriisuperbiae TaxID=2854389 RepID=UPI0028E590EA|nr:DUF2628 domain-containing protein [Bradyrhizobium prioritasuperba]